VGRAEISRVLTCAPFFGAAATATARAARAGAALTALAIRVTAADAFCFVVALAETEPRRDDDAADLPRGDGLLREGLATRTSCSFRPTSTEEPGLWPLSVFVANRL